MNEELDDILFGALLSSADAATTVAHAHKAIQSLLLQSRIDELESLVYHKNGDERPDELIGFDARVRLAQLRKENRQS